MKKQMTVRKTVLAALFLAIGLILPFITMQIPAVGKMLCPMHIPVLLCGYILGGPYGLIVGFITPLLRSVSCSRTLYAWHLSLQLMDWSAEFFPVR